LRRKLFEPLGEQVYRQYLQEEEQYKKTDGEKVQTLYGEGVVLWEANADQKHQ
jgi:hypothetical protein